MIELVINVALATAFGGEAIILRREAKVICGDAPI
jgi:hypothetical protein